MRGTPSRSTHGAFAALAHPAPANFLGGADAGPDSGAPRAGAPLPAGSKSLYGEPLDGGDRLTGSQRPRRASWAVWLAVLALVLEALVPVHLALDLDEALGVAHRAAPGAVRHGFEWRLLALAAGHEIGDGKPDG